MSFQNISDCNCELCISDVIVVTEATILLNFYAGTLAVEFPAVPPKTDIALCELNVRQRTDSELGSLFDQLIGAQQPVWFIDLAVLRLIDSLQYSVPLNGLWRHAIYG